MCTHRLSVKTILTLLFYLSCIIIYLFLYFNFKDSVCEGVSSKSKSRAVEAAASLDALFSEQVAESFLTRFLDTKRIEEFVKSVPAGQEPLEITAIVPTSAFPSLSSN